MDSRFKGMICSTPVNPSKAENQFIPETVSSVYSSAIMGRGPLNRGFSI